MIVNPWRKRKILISFFVILMTLMISIFIFFQSPRVQKRVLNYFSEQVYAKTGWKVSIDHFEGLLPLQVRAYNLEFLSPEETHIYIEQLHLVIAPWDLIRGKWELQLAEAEKIIIEESKKAVEGPPHSKNFALQTFPWVSFDVAVHRFNLTDITVENKNLPLNFSGSLEIKAEKKFVNLDLFLSEKNSTFAPVELDTTLSLVNDRFLASIHVHDPQHGYLSHFFPARQHHTTLDFFADLSGALEEWQKWITFQEGAGELKGTFSLGSYITSTYKKENLSHLLSMQGIVELSAKKFISFKDIQAEFQEDNGNDSPNTICSFHGNMDVDHALEITNSHFHVEIPSIAFLEKRFHQKFEGAFVGDGYLSRQLLSPLMNFKLTSAHCHIVDKDYKNFIFESSLQHSHKGMDGDVKVNVDIDDLATAQAKTTILWHDPKKIVLANMQFSLADSLFSGDAEYDFEKHLLLGNFDANITDLSLFSSFAKTKLKGKGTLHATLSKQSSSDEQVIDLRVEGSQVAVGNLSLGDLFFKTTYEAKKEKWPYELKFDKMDQFSSNLSSRGSWKVSLAENKKGEEQQINFMLAIDELTGKLKSQDIVLQHPFSLKAINSTIELSPLAISIGKGTIFTHVEFSGDQTKLNAEANDVPLDIIPLVSPLPALSGTIYTKVELQGDRKSQMIGKAEMRFNNIKFNDKSLDRLPSFGIDCSLDFTKDKLLCDAVLKNTPVKLQAELPLTLYANPFSIEIFKEKPLQLHFNVEGEIAHLLHALLIETTSITGYLKGGLDIDGTVANPNIKGRAELNNGSYESLVSGAVFKDIKVVFSGNGDELQLVEATAIDGNGGTVTGRGAIELDIEKNFPFNIQLNMNNVNLLHLDYARAIASGTLNYLGDFTKQALEGELTVEQATIRIPEEVPAQMQAIEVTYINQQHSEKAPMQFKKKKKMRPIFFNVKLNVPRNAFLIGKDLQSEWFGEILFKGTDDEPLIEGALNGISGEYLFNGKKFEMQNGTISFAGEPGNKTTLYVTAGQDIDDIKVEVILKGPIKKPQLAFRSNPPMSQKEILSWILFSRGTNDITPTQNDELSKSIITLSGGDNSTDLLGKIRRSFGIDRIDISSKSATDSDKVSLRVGKYIAKGLFLSVNKSITADTNQVGIEANLSRYIKAQAEVGDDSEGKIILKWQRDY